MQLLTLNTITKADNAASEGYYCTLVVSDLKSWRNPRKVRARGLTKILESFLENVGFVPKEYQKSVYFIWTMKKDVV